MDAIIQEKKKCWVEVSTWATQPVIRKSLREVRYVTLHGWSNSAAITLYIGQVKREKNKLCLLGCPIFFCSQKSNLTLWGQVLRDTVLPGFTIWTLLLMGSSVRSRHKRTENKTEYSDEGWLGFLCSWGTHGCSLYWETYTC